MPEIWTNNNSCFECRRIIYSLLMVLFKLGVFILLIFKCRSVGQNDVVHTTMLLYNFDESALFMIILKNRIVYQEL